MAPPIVGAALALAPGGVEVDPLTGHVSTDERLAGLSAADEAALEWALRLAERWDRSVLAVSAGPPANDRVLRDALAAGASRAVRVDHPAVDDPAGVAAAIAPIFRGAGATVVLCGDAGTTAGSGAVPAFLAHRLGAAQALGLIGVTIGEEPGTIDALRRLDGGRRERLRAAEPSVLSVEGSTARLRRAGLAAVLAAGRAEIEVVTPAGPGTATEPQLRPYRPRARVLAAPTGPTALDRVRALTDAGTPRTSTRTVTADPAEAAETVLAQLQEWGELDG